MAKKLTRAQKDRRNERARERRADLKASLKAFRMQGVVGVPFPRPRAKRATVARGARGVGVRRATMIKPKKPKKPKRKIPTQRQLEAKIKREVKSKVKQIKRLTDSCLKNIRV